ncbi:MAG TPA: histidine phosphatase family protein [Planctomycetota bacterium]|jgi:probable phosphoglycerate mutase|nr:histidine phosphatase family protein [Planctomycetota bacterium]
MPDPTRIFWIRHGEVDASWSGRVYGDLDVPLSKRGRLQSKEVAEWLEGTPLDAVVATGLERSRVGALAVAAPHGLPVTLERDLRELDRGAWRGLSWEEVEARFPGGRRRFLEEEDYREHGGESLRALGERVGGAIERLLARHPSGKIAVVGHMWPIRLAVASAVGLRPTRVHHLHVEPGAIGVIDYHGRSAVLVALNLRQAPPAFVSEPPP